MLKHLSITNYAIIENVELELSNGFTVITGETGAGKSILLGALSLVLGQRADSSVLNNKQKKCIVEAEFELNDDEHIEFFKNHDLDYEENNIIRREITAAGKSRAFINDTPVNLQVLKELTSQLIDIHSQHQTLQIKDNKFQIDVVDAFANLDKELESYGKKYIEYVKSKQQLKSLLAQEDKAKSDIDYVSFQINEIEALKLKANEKEDIVAKLELINNAEEIKVVLESSKSKLIDSDKNLVSELKTLANSFLRITKCSEEYNAIYERLNSVVIELEDICGEIEERDSSLNFNADNSLYLNERLSKIFAIEQKHNLSSTEEILSLLETFNTQLQSISFVEKNIKEITDAVENQKIELISIAEKISEKRKTNFDKLIKVITSNLYLLGMPNSVIDIKHQLLNDLTENGLDEIEFLFSSNKGVSPSELKKVASGGELSRLMLTIKSILAKNKKLSSIIFDEIDSGVSGDISDKMADLMKQMGNDIQVIAITHLPQVAAKGTAHYKIYKESDNDKTLTSILLLDDDGRVEELTKMLSGKDLSAAARENAKSLLNI